MSTTKQKGFTLVELSIVIVIIGLIVAGITAGQSLVRQSRIKGTLTDIDMYKSAVNTFYLEYNELPGDMSKATSYWGTTASGNGNKSVDWVNEVYRSWQHLYLAGLIANNMPGTNTANFADVGINVPASKLSDTIGYNLRTSNQFHSKLGLYVMVGGERAATWADTSAVTTKELYSVDAKLDDGIPGKGIVQGIGGSEHASANNICETTYNNINSTYVVTNTGLTCRMVFFFPY